MGFATTKTTESNIGFDILFYLVGDNGSETAFYQENTLVVVVIDSVRVVETFQIVFGNMWSQLSQIGRYVRPIYATLLLCDCG